MVTTAMHDMSTPPSPSQHCRDAKFYGPTTMAMHDMSTPPRSIVRLAFLSAPGIQMLNRLRIIWRRRSSIAQSYVRHQVPGWHHLTVFAIFLAYRPRKCVHNAYTDINKTQTRCLRRVWRWTSLWASGLLSVSISRTCTYIVHYVYYGHQSTKT